MQILHHNSQAYASGQALKKPPKHRGQAGSALPPSPMDTLLPNLSVHFVQAIGEILCMNKTLSLLSMSVRHCSARHVWYQLLPHHLTISAALPLYA